MVISIIGLLSAVVLTSLSASRSSARNAQRLQNIDQIAKALQIVTTGTTNQLPASGGTAVCLGKAFCWCLGSTCIIEEYPPLTGLLKSGISGEELPLDPFWVDGQNGDAYVYNAIATSPGPTGAYLYWTMEGLSSQRCGRGTVLSVDTTTRTGGVPSYSCRLYLGPPTPGNII